MFLKRILAIISTAAIAISILTGTITVLAEDTIITGSCGDNARWSLDTLTGILTISGTGDMYTQYKPVYDWGYYRYRNEIKEVIVENGITYISECAFGPFDPSLYEKLSAYPNLTKLTLSSSVKSIGAYAFYKTGIEIISFSEGLEKIGESAFAYTSLSGDLVIPQTLNNIGSFSFVGTNITSVNLHEGMYIGGQSFAYINSLKEVIIPKDIIYILTPSSNSGLANAAFLSCESLEKVIIKGGGIVEIQYSGSHNKGLGDNLFNGCTSLKEIIIDSRDIEYVDLATFNAEGAQQGGTFWLENHPTFYIYKDSTTETTLKRAGCFRNANVQYIADFENLKTAIEKAEGIEADKYTDESVSDFNEVLENGRDVLEDLTSTQEEVDSAVKAINSAIKALEVKKDEPTSDDVSDNSSEPSDSQNPSSSNNPSVTTPTAKPTTAVPKVVTPNPTFTKVVKPAKVKAVKVKAKKKKLNVSWKKVSGATGYEIQYATNNKFTKNNKSVTVKKNKVTLKRLKSKKKYFVKVRAYKTVNGNTYYGKWSKVVKKKTK